MNDDYKQMYRILYTSFSKRERQYDPCRAKEINNPGTRMYRKSVGENKQEQAKTRTSLICIPRSLSVSNNMTRVGRKKLTIQGPVWSESVGDSSKSVGDNKQAKYVYLVL